MVYFDHSFQHCLDAGMQNGDDALSSTILVGRGILVKMLITLNGMLYMYFDNKNSYLALTLV